MDFSFVNPLAIIIAAISTFIVGYPWYGKPLFGDAWQREAKVVPQKNPNMAKTMGTALVYALVQAFLLELFIGPVKDIGFGIFVGLAVGLGWVGTAMANSNLFEGRSTKLTLINVGYNAVIFTLMSVICTLL